MNAVTLATLAECQHLAQAAWPGLKLALVPTIDSTNLELQRRWRVGQREAILLVAQEQTAGRGRLGRPWHSLEQSSLTFSVGLPLPLRNWSGLSLVVGLAVAQALHPAIGLKWPNDLWLILADQLPKKLGGILIESMGGAGDDTGLIIGIGVNIAPYSFDSVSVPPAFLQSLLPTITPLAALACIIPHLMAAITQFMHTGFAPFQAQFAQRDVLVNKAVQLSNGQSGIAVGVDIDGALLLQSTQAHPHSPLQRVVSGEVSVRPSALPITPAR